MENTKTPKPMRWMVILSAIFLAASLIVSGVNAYVALASGLQSQSPNVPLRVGFEGQLADSEGNPVTGSKTLTFKLYDEATGAADPLWTEQQTVTVTNGLYSVELGSVSALEASDFQGDRWLGIQVQGDENELSPRIPINAVPFALNAKLSENSISSEGLQGNPVASTTPTAGQMLTWTGSVWEPKSITDGAGRISVSNVFTETPILTRTIPGNSLSTNKYFTTEFWVLPNLINAGHSKQLTFRIKFGSKIVSYVTTVGIDSSSTKRQAFLCQVVIGNTGSANSQDILLRINTAGSIAPGGIDSVSDALVYEIASIDTTTDQEFQITFQMENPGSGATFSTNVVGARFDAPFLSQ